MTTKANLDHMFERFVANAPKAEGYHWALESNAPGDGATRYRVYLVADEGGACFSPFGDLFALGKSAAYEMLRALCVGMAMQRDGLGERFTRAA
jgi:hypothetical protein